MDPVIAIPILWCCFGVFLSFFQLFREWLVVTAWMVLATVPLAAISYLWTLVRG